MQIFFYRALLRVYLHMMIIARYLFGYRLSLLLRRIAIAVRYVLFPSFSADLAQFSPDSTDAVSKTHYGPMPQWLVKDIILTGDEFDSDLYSVTNSVNSIIPTSFLDNPHAAGLLRKLFDACTRDYYDAIFVVPAYVGGGAEKHARMLAHSLASRGASVLFIAENDSAQDSLIRANTVNQTINRSFNVISLHQICDLRNSHHMSYTLAYFLSASRPKLIYTCNSELGYKTLVDYGKQLSSRSALITGAWCYDYDSNLNEVGYVRRYLPKIYHWLSFIISDNSVFPEQLIHKHGYSKEKFCVFPAPIGPPKHVWSAPPPTAAPRVLWAGRWCRQKRVDLLLQIAMKLSHIHFDVYGFATDNVGLRFQSEARKLANIKLKGRFHTFEDIDIASTSLFLYTSAWDGMPNVLLEAASVGLPIIASLVGGIPDCFNPHNAVLLDSTASLNDYIQALSDLLYHPSKAATLGRNVSLSISNRHNIDSYQNAMEPIFQLLDD